MVGVDHKAIYSSYQIIQGLACRRVRRFLPEKLGEMCQVDRGPRVVSFRFAVRFSPARSEHNTVCETAIGQQLLAECRSGWVNHGDQLVILAQVQK